MISNSFFELYYIPRDPITPSLETILLTTAVLFILYIIPRIEYDNEIVWHFLTIEILRLVKTNLLFN